MTPAKDADPIITLLNESTPVLEAETGIFLPADLDFEPTDLAVKLVFQRTLPALLIL